MTYMERTTRSLDQAWLPLVDSSACRDDAAPPGCVWATSRWQADGRLAAAEDLFYGIDVARNQEEGVRITRQLATDGNPWAQYRLGRWIQWLHVNDSKPAAYWFSLAADQGHLDALIELGYCFIDGNGVPADPCHAYALFRCAAEHGDYLGALNMGQCYEEGIGVAADLEQAVRWYIKAAPIGHDRLRGLGYVRRGSEWVNEVPNRFHALGYIRRGSDWVKEIPTVSGNRAPLGDPLERRVGK